MEIFTDASNEGWGAQYNGVTTQGTWSTREVALHINVKELLAVLFGLKSLLKDIHNVNVKLNVDNTTAVSVIKHMGTSHSDDLNKVAKDIWLWAMHREVWLFPVYISSADNPADEPSRNIYVDAEWQLNPAIFAHVVSILNFVPDIDLFASRLNTQLEKYVSYHPDPEAFNTDAFSLSWSHLKFYCFPPFSCISQCLQKILSEKATGLIIVPQWPTQPFYPILLRMTVGPPVRIPPKVSNLQMPGQPLLLSDISRRTAFLACLVSGTLY